MQELWPYVTPWRASLSYRSYVHIFIMHVSGWKVDSPTRGLLHWTEKDGKWRKGSKGSSLLKGSWEHQRWSSETQIRLNKCWSSNGKGMSAVFYGNTACPRPIEAAPLFFSSEQQQQCLQSSTNDNLCSCSVALLIVHHLHIFQGHQITASLLCMVH